MRSVVNSNLFSFSAEGRNTIGVVRVVSPVTCSVRWDPWAIPENRGFQKMEIQFFSIENNSISTSFSKKFVTLYVTTNMSKLVDNACLWQKILNFIFFMSLFSGIANPCHPITWVRPLSPVYSGENCHPPGEFPGNFRWFFCSFMLRSLGRYDSPTLPRQGGVT